MRVVRDSGQWGPDDEGEETKRDGERLYVCMNTCACECEYECVYQGEWETDCLTRDTESPARAVEEEASTPVCLLWKKGKLLTNKAVKK